jgi:hypothetical protein
VPKIRSNVTENGNPLIIESGFEIIFAPCIKAPDRSVEITVKRNKVKCNFDILGILKRISSFCDIFIWFI